MKFELTTDLGNETMRTWADIADALGQVQDRIDQTKTGSPRSGRGGGSESGAIKDLNGNAVGGWMVVS